MIEEARRLHPSLLAVTIAFFLGFLVIVGATVASVVTDEMPKAASIDSIALPAGVVVVDQHTTCSPDACDGEGVVVESLGLSAPTVLAIVEGRLVNGGWTSYDCGTLASCLSRADLRVSIQLWSDADDTTATAAMRDHLDGMDIDQTALVYIRIWRCDILTACA